MGMFDYVEYEAKCPKCGASITDWQSKDGDCLMDVLTPKDVRYFYTSCPVCGVWIDAFVQPPKEIIVELQIRNDTDE
jgi:uncharacterized protein (UPF0212 family)